MRLTDELKNVLTTAMAIVLMSSFCGMCFAQQRGIIDNSASPHCKLRSVDLDDVKWTDGFWADKFTLVKDVTIPKMWEYYNRDDETLMGYHWINFRIAAGLQDGSWKGRSWHDGDFYKWLEAVAHVYAVTRNPELDKQMDEAIEIIGKVQEPDGYITTQVIVEKVC